MNLEGNFFVDTCGNLIINEGVEMIPDYFFCSQKIKSVKFPTSLKQIGKYAFKDNNITSIDFPNALILIGQDAFSINQLSSITFCNGIMVIESGAFSDNNIENLILPDSIKKIGNNAFANNQIKNLKLPSNITEICKGVFKNNQLVEVNIPNLVNYIGKFSFCKNEICKLKLPNILKTIDECAFAFNEIREVIIPNSVDMIGSGAFTNNGEINISVFDNTKINEEVYDTSGRIIRIGEKNSDELIYEFNEIDEKNVQGKFKPVSELTIEELFGDDIEKFVDIKAQITEQKSLNDKLQEEIYNRKKKERRNQILSEQFYILEDLKYETKKLIDEINEIDKNQVAFGAKTIEKKEL